MDSVNSNEYSGIICVDKPRDFTSFDVIAKMRGIMHMKRLGHAGTLDPMATGVLPIFVGTATKACDMLPDHDKSYKAGFKLGITTDTQDIWGKELKRADYSHVAFEDIKSVSKNFVGDIMQIPPMYSAVSVNGKRLYELARAGKTVEREPRQVTVYSLDILEYDAIDGSGVMTISCSKGTYIRTIIEDIGNALNCGGIMTSLERVSACGFSKEDCVTLDDLQEIASTTGDFSKVIMPIESVFEYLPKAVLNTTQEKLYRNGVKLDPKRINLEVVSKQYAVYGSSGFIGTAIIKDDLFCVEKNFRITKEAINVDITDK